MAAPPTPQRKSTFRSRVGGAIRRSSTAFSIPGLPNRGNSATPPPPQDSDTASIAGSVSSKLDREGPVNKIDTTPLQPPASVSSAPSPIPESPAREAAALAAEPQPAAVKAPSPLANEVLKADAASKQGATPPRSVAGTPPPPAVESVAAKPSEITERQPPQTVPAVVVDEPKAEIAPVLTAEPEEIPAQRLAAPSAPSSGTHSPPVSAPPSAPVTPAALATNATSYFGDIPRSTTPIGLESEPDTNVWADHRAPGSDSGSEADVAYKQGSTSSRSVSRTPPPPAAQSVHARAPPTSQRKSTFRSRVGGAIRRSSTAFSIPGLPSRGGSATPPPLQDSDTASIAESVSGKLDREGPVNKIDTTPLQPPASVKSAPNPIAESPAREAAALVAEPQPAAVQAPSPLANEVLEADAASKQGSTPPQSVSGTPPAAVESVPVKPSVIAERQSSQMYDSPNEQKDERYSVSDVYNNQAPNSNNA
ncbi:hypothetical protein V8E55_001380 [Tylopilus felleus]